VPSDENDLIISSINALDLGWKADTCKLQKHHAQYGEHCEALNLAQTKAKEDVDAELESESEYRSLGKMFESHKNFA
jgi:hypothetical protein